MNHRDSIFPSSLFASPWLRRWAPLLAAFLGSAGVAFLAGEQAAVAEPASRAKAATVQESRAASAAERRLERKTRRDHGIKRRGKRNRRARVCSRQRGVRRCRWVREFQGHAVEPSKLREAPPSKPSGKISLYSATFAEEIAVNIYDSSGDFDEEALSKLDHVFRCRRSRRERAADPRLYETMSAIYDHFGKQIHLQSGFRYQRNEGSRHFHASAMDIRIPGVSARDLYDFAESLDTGGMGIGIYPRSHFVHIDWRAPGEKSYRWTDYSGPKGGKTAPAGKRTSS